MILSFYTFIELKDLISIKLILQKECSILDFKGTIIISNEGINFNIEGKKKKLAEICCFLTKKQLFGNVNFITCFNNTNAFQRLKLKLKKESITSRINNISIKKNTTSYLSTQEWDILLSISTTILIDTRNYYEYASGSFKGSINPKIHNFSELKNWLDVKMKSLSKSTSVAMFCTGGIRCEKGTAYLKQKGFKNIYQLRGGILSYLSTNQNNNLWRGKCFLFDDRSSI
jgi:UPF0176 protein